jgi:glycosyltransferase involved in cell wall biosynthesis
LERLPILERKNIPVCVLGVNEAWDGRRYCQELSRILVDWKVRIVHINSWLRWPWIAEALRDCGIPGVLTLHGTVARPRFKDWVGINRKPFYLYRERREFSRLALPIISISEQSATNLAIRFNHALRTTVVHCGVADPITKAEPQIPVAVAQIIWVGSMIPRKRPLLALQALACLLERGCRCRLVMLGDGPLMAKVKEAANRLSIGDVDLMGTVEDVERQLRSSQILLHTASNEGIPYAILDAMAHRLPIVAVNSGAMSEAVIHDQTGHLVPLGKESLLPDFVGKLVDSPKLRENFGLSGYQLFKRNFSISAMVEGTLAAYDKLADVKI